MLSQYYFPFNILSFLIIMFYQGDLLSGKAGNVREFDSCQGNIRYFTKSHGNVREKILLRKSCLKLFIVSCIFASVTGDQNWSKWWPRYSANECDNFSANSNVWWSLGQGIKQSHWEQSVEGQGCMVPKLDSETWWRDRSLPHSVKQTF